MTTTPFLVFAQQPFHLKVLANYPEPYDFDYAILMPNKHTVTGSGHHDHHTLFRVCTTTFSS